jgi:tetratricopeptide (TPR) repeat protein
MEEEIEGLKYSLHQLVNSYTRLDHYKKSKIRNGVKRISKYEIKQGNFSDAIKTIEQIIKVHEIDGLPLSVAIERAKIGTIYGMMFDFENAEKFLNIAQEKSKNSHNNYVKKRIKRRVDNFQAKRKLWDDAISWKKKNSLIESSIKLRYNKTSEWLELPLEPNNLEQMEICSLFEKLHKSTNNNKILYYFSGKNTTGSVLKDDNDGKYYKGLKFSKYNKTESKFPIKLTRTNLSILLNMICFFPVVLIIVLGQSLIIGGADTYAEIAAYQTLGTGIAICVTLLFAIISEVVGWHNAVRGWNFIIFVALLWMGISRVELFNSSPLPFNQNLYNGIIWAHIIGGIIALIAGIIYKEKD